MNNEPKIDLDDLLINYGKAPATGEEIPEPGSPENPWIGTNHFVHGQKQFRTFSGSERRRLRRQIERDARNERVKGERAYNRELQKREFDAGTRRQQLRILKGEVEVSPAMRANLEGHILREQKAHQARQVEPQRREAAAKRRADRLTLRQQYRISIGQARHRDLVATGLREP